MFEDLCQGVSVGQEKAELKAAFLHELGVKYDDMLEECERDRYRAEGAALALNQAQKRINQLMTLVKDDLAKERYEEETATKIREYILRAVTQTSDMARAQDQQRFAYVGKADGLRAIIAQTKKAYDAEKARAAELEEVAGVDSTDPRTRVVGQAPGIPEFKLRDKEEEHATDN